MRIGWATPWNERSAIAQVAAEVADELTAFGHTITIIRTETERGLALPARAARCPVLNLDDISDSDLARDYDIVVAHIGNYVDFHGALIPRLPRVPCVGIFHDAYLADLAAGWAFRSGGGGEAELRGWVRDTYGDGAWRAEETYVDEQTLSDVAARRPMLEWLARQTIGAVAHSSFYVERLQNLVPGPVGVIPLGMTYQSLPSPPALSTETTIGFIGHANYNKRIDQVIMAVGSSPFLRQRCRFRVIGEATEDTRRRLAVLARSAKVMPPEFVGWVSDEEMRWQLRDVNIISCLRSPVLEGGSASLILAMTSGRPTLVSNHGCYADVPEDLVLRCTPGAEALDVMRHLERLVADSDSALAMGRRAQAFALERYSPACYARALEPILEQAAMLEQAMPDRWFEKARHVLHDTLRELGLGRDDRACVRADETISSLRYPLGKSLHD
jgi:glycosyltransferase involved in cell wall biosynthesis